MFCYKFNCVLSPDVFDNFFAKVSNVHWHHTRSQCNFHVRASRTIYVDKSVKYRGTLLWSQSRDSIKKSRYVGVAPGQTARRVDSEAAMGMVHSSRMVNSNKETKIDLLHKSHNAAVPYPTMYHFVTEVCTCIHIPLQNGALWDMPDTFWDLWDASIGLACNVKYNWMPDMPNIKSFQFPSTFLEILHCGLSSTITKIHTLYYCRAISKLWDWVLGFENESWLHGVGSFVAEPPIKNYKGLSYIIVVLGL